jgi:hypothetical protein
MPKWKTRVNTFGKTRRRFGQMNPAGREMVHRLLTLLSIEVGKDMTVAGDEMLTSEAVRELQATVESLPGRKGPQRIRLASTNFKKALWVKAVCRAAEYTLGVEITATRSSPSESGGGDVLSENGYTFHWVRNEAPAVMSAMCEHEVLVGKCKNGCCPPSMRIITQSTGEDVLAAYLACQAAK